jgi:hypothetical protein
MKQSTKAAPIEKLVSGGQTGVDCASLDVALELGIPCGGWCPKGRWSEAGAIPAIYPLQETPSEDVAQRTEWNARDSDGTLVIVEGPTVGGTTLTVDMAVRYGKPYLIVDLLKGRDGVRASVRSWLAEHGIRVLNVAGPRESTTPGINEKTKALLRLVLGAGA